MLSGCQPFCIHTEDKSCFLRFSRYMWVFFLEPAFLFYGVFVRQSHGGVEQLFKLLGSKLLLFALQGLS